MLFAVAAAGCVSSLAQISPGKLSAPHEDLEGNLNCMNCHDAEHGVSPERCLACHKPLRDRISRGTGLHARSDHSDCRTCHMEHAGREFELIWWGEAGRDSLDHATTGYVLEGAHAKLDCRQCHRRENIQDRGPLLEGRKDLDRTFLGLDAGCLACHSDEHDGQYRETECETCHSMDRWKPADRFDHTSTGYPLLGRHQTVACAECHLPRRGDAEASRPGDLRFRGIAADQCTDCHFDEHRGQFVADRCESCHALDAWQPTIFDHAACAYPLTGSHRQVECARCHGTAIDPASAAGESYRVLRGIAHATCADCHTDTHEGRLGPSCVGCHVTDSWKSTGRDTFDHGLTRYPLEGKHRDLRCEQCHSPGAPLQIADFDRCETCHRDAHAGQFAEREDGDACGTCHAVEGFRPSRYTVVQHQRSSFPLEGAHKTTPCEDCHRVKDPAGVQQPTATTEPILRFRFDSPSCASCHDDPHRGSLDRFLADGGCEGCHGTASWTEVQFDHGLTRFRLEDAHAKAACGQCHRRRQPDGSDALEWACVGMQCVDCHPDPHRRQFDQAGRPTDCRDCHGVTDWKSLAFDHDRDSLFRLAGAHARARCEACHRVEEFDDGTMVRFRPVSGDCASCHKPPRPSAEKPR